MCPLLDSETGGGMTRVYLEKLEYMTMNKMDQFKINLSNGHEIWMYLCLVTIDQRSVCRLLVIA